MQNSPLIGHFRKLAIPSGDSSLKPYQDDGRSTLHPPEFPRSPRDYIPYPDDEVSIQLPPAEPSPPTTSLFTILMPVLGMVVMVLVIVFVVSGQWSYALYSLPVALFSAGAGVFNHFRNKKKYKEQLETRKTSYLQYLTRKRTDLADLIEQQRDANLAAHPDLHQCFEYVQNLTPTKLWDREYGDPDFLDIRLGMGESTATFSVKVPEASQFQITPDPLEENARSLQQEFSRVPNVAVTLPLTQVGAAGFIGQRNQLIALIRSAILHLVTHHSPDEVKVVVLCSEKENDEWDWVRWLPHNWNDGRDVRFFGNSKATHASVIAHIELLLKQRKNQQSINDQIKAPIPAFVIIWADSNLWRGQEAIKFSPLTNMILKDGKKIGAYSLFLSERISRVPKACEAIVRTEVDFSEQKLLGTKPQKFTLQPDLTDRMQAWSFALSLAPVRLEDAIGNATNLPSSITLLELIGASKVEQLDVLSLWEQSEPHKNLSVPIGVGTGGKRLFLNLHEKGHGPHGLVAGTTGSGKTALLSTYLALAALYYHPHELGFIGIDFKGGDLIRELKDLPHMIGTMTNLDGSGTDRAIKILRGEIKKRQALFNSAGIGNIYDYQKLYRKKDPRITKAMPHLVIVCDEFAELKKEQPDFIRELISISRVGRSLGIHLILATQKPAGVVSDEIWSNSHFHLCLKVASLEDSREMLRRPEAADITQQGRAYFQVGMNEVFELFQAAWGDAPYLPQETSSQQPRVRHVRPDGAREDLWPPQNVAIGTGKTQIQELVSYIVDNSAKNRIKRLDDIWPPALSEQAGKTLHEICKGSKGWNGKTWIGSSSHLKPILGIKDDPEQQKQELLRIDLENNGHLAIFGSAGSGKTTCLQTIITSIVSEHTPEDVHLYLLDFSGRNLTLFENLPHVGAVIALGENERLRRLFTLLHNEMEYRKKLIENDQTFVKYRQNHPKDKVAEIVVVLDGYSHFADAYKLQTVTTEIDNIIRLASQGGNLGMHLVLTTDQVKTFPTKLMGNIKDVVATELNDFGDYTSVVGKTSGLFPPKDSPGRGLIKGQPVKEFQAALPASNSMSIKQLSNEMEKAWTGTIPKQVPVLPDVIRLSELVPLGVERKPSQSGFSVSIGLDMSQPELPQFRLSLSAGPHFWISGLPQSGKTTLLQSWLLGLAEKYSPEQIRFFLVDMGWGNFEVLQRLPHTINCVTDLADFKTQLLQEQLEAFVNVEKKGNKTVALDDPSKPSVIFAVDGLGGLQKGLNTDKTAETNRDYLLSLIRVRNARFHLLATGTTNEFTGGSTMNPLGETLRGFQSGIWLGDGTNSDAYNFNFQFMMGESTKGLPKGAGFYVNRGKYIPIQLATCHEGPPVIDEWIQQIVLRESPEEI